jgi:hypothetical protein
MLQFSCTIEFLMVALFTLVPLPMLVCGPMVQLFKDTFSPMKHGGWMVTFSPKLAAFGLNKWDLFSNTRWLVYTVAE